MSVRRPSLVTAVLWSLAFDPSARADAPSKEECVAANEGAQHLKRTHRFVEAKQLLLTCIATTCPAPVRDDCLDMLDAIQKSLPTVVFVVRGTSGKELRAVRVTMDGVAIAQDLDGSALEVDPGAHSFSFESDGFEWKTETLRIRERDRERRMNVLLKALPAAEPPPTERPEVPASAPPMSAQTPIPIQTMQGATSRDSDTWKRTAAFVALGVGAAGVAGAVIFGLAALDHQAVLETQCRTNGDCPASSRDDVDALHTNAVASDVGLAVGLLGLGAGGALLFFSRNDGAIHRAASGTENIVRPWIGLGVAGLRGRFR